MMRHDVVKDKDEPETSQNAAGLGNDGEINRTGVERLWRARTNRLRDQNG